MVTYGCCSSDNFIRTGQHFLIKGRSKDFFCSELVFARVKVYTTGDCSLLRAVMCVKCCPLHHWKAFGFFTKNVNVCLKCLELWSVGVNEKNQNKIPDLLPSCIAFRPKSCRSIVLIKTVCKSVFQFYH